jgi:hypothetical protein
MMAMVMPCPEPEELWARIDRVLLEIKPDLDDVGLAAIRSRIDPAAHHWATDTDEQALQSAAELTRLHEAARELQAAWGRLTPPTVLLLRQAAHQHEDDLSAALATLDSAIDTIKRARVLRRGYLAPRVARAVAAAIAGVYFDLAGRTPTTSHPDQRTTPEPYHELVQAVFETFELKNWKERATEAAKEQMRHLRGNVCP